MPVEGKEFSTQIDAEASFALGIWMRKGAVGNSINYNNNSVFENIQQL